MDELKAFAVLGGFVVLLIAALLGVAWGVVALQAIDDHQTELKACRAAGGRPAGEGDNWFCDRTAAGSAVRP